LQSFPSTVWRAATVAHSVASMPPPPPVAGGKAGIASGQASRAAARLGRTLVLPSLPVIRRSYTNTRAACQAQSQPLARGSRLEARGSRLKAHDSDHQTGPPRAVHAARTDVREALWPTAACHLGHGAVAGVAMAGLCNTQQPHLHVAQHAGQQHGGGAHRTCLRLIVTRVRRAPPPALNRKDSPQ